jgi:hypothetical protein
MKKLNKLKTKISLIKSNIKKIKTEYPQKDNINKVYQFIIQKVPFIQETTRFYITATKQLLNNYKSAISIYKKQKQRTFKTTTRNEDLFMAETVKGLLLIPIILVPGSTLIIPIIAFIYPGILPNSFHRKAYFVFIYFL